MANFDYRAAKKILNKYHKFSFELPRKGKDLNRGQKAAIRRIYNKLGDAIMRVQEGEYSFLKNKKLGDGLRTNKGTILQYPEAETRKQKTYRAFKVTPIRIGFGKRREILLVFPKSIRNSMDRIENFVTHFKKQYNPDYIRWAFKNQRASEVYNPGTYTLYATVALSNIMDRKKGIEWEDGRMIGVYFGWVPDNTMFK